MDKTTLLFRQIVFYYTTTSLQYFARLSLGVCQAANFLKVFYRVLKCLTDLIMEGKTTNYISVYKCNFLAFCNDNQYCQIPEYEVINSEYVTHSHIVWHSCANDS